MWNSLEVVKLFVGILTPVAIAIVGYVISNKLERQRSELTRLQIRLASRNEFQKLTLEINKEVIRDPSLDEFDHPGQKRDQAAVKIEALAYITMNMFELVYEYYKIHEALTEREDAEWKVWEAMIQDGLAESPALRELVWAPDSERIYIKEFYDYIKRKADEVCRKSQPK